MILSYRSSIKYQSNLQHQQPSQPPLSPLSRQHWNSSSFSPRNCLSQQQLTVLPEAPPVPPLTAKLISIWASCTLFLRLTVKKKCWHSGANAMCHTRCWHHSQRSLSCASITGIRWTGFQCLWMADSRASQPPHQEPGETGFCENEPRTVVTLICTDLLTVSLTTYCTTILLMCISVRAICFIVQYATYKRSDAMLAIAM